MKLGFFYRFLDIDLQRAIQKFHKRHLYVQNSFQWLRIIERSHSRTTQLILIIFDKGYGNELPGSIKGGIFLYQLETVKRSTKVLCYIISRQSLLALCIFFINIFQFFNGSSGPRPLIQLRNHFFFHRR
jgi:hypothetical protein